MSELRNKDGVRHSEILETEDFVPATTLVYLHRVPHDFSTGDLINGIESIFQSKVLFHRIKFHNDYPGVVNGICSFAIDTQAVLTLRLWYRMA